MKRAHIRGGHLTLVSSTYIYRKRFFHVRLFQRGVKPPSSHIANNPPLGGFCKLPDFAWNDWGIGQVERVWDLMDISLLRSAIKGVDPSFKT